MALRIPLLPVLRPLALALLLTPASQAAPPVIQHDPVKVAPRGKAKTMIARVTVPSGSVQAVNLYVTQSADSSPLKIDMKPSGAPGTYFGTIPAAYLQNKGTLRYYIEALASDGDWKETNWMSMAVQDADTLPPGTEPDPSETVSGRPRWFWPAVAVGGGALVVAGAVALSDSGGGGSDDTTPPPPDDGGNLAGRILTRTVRDDAEGIAQLLPKDTVVDVTAELNGRTVQSVRVDLTVDSVDGRADSVQVRYNSSSVLETGPVVTSVSRTITLSGSSPVVVIRVVNSDLDDTGNQNYSVTATVTYILEP
jgi:hypothetical protein